MAEERDKALYRKLLEEGTPKEEIEAVYKKLRARGYGEAAAARRMQQAMQHMQQQNRDGTATPSARQPAAARTTESGYPDKPARLPDDSEPAQQLPLMPRLRRRVNRWAFRRGLLITGVTQRWHDALSLVRPREPDTAHPRLIRALASPHNVTTLAPDEWSLADTLHALRSSSRRLIGELAGSGQEAVLQSYRRRDSFALEYLSRFSREQKKLIASLARLDAAVLDGAAVPVAELVRPTRELYRLVLTTEQVSHKRVADALAVGKDIVLAYARPVSAPQLSDAVELFVHAIEQLQRFKRELYPVVLKAVGEFFDEYDESERKRVAIYRFVGITDEDILTFKQFAERQTRLREMRLVEEKKRELEDLEMEKEAGFSRRHQGVLSVLSAIFPESGIERLEQNRYLLPYFDTRVFVQSLPFGHHGANIEAVAADDPIQPLVVLHRVIDNLLASIDHQSLERLLMREQTAAALADIKSRWSAIYNALFAPCLRALTAYAKGLDERDDYARGFGESLLARSLREEISDYRAAMFRNWSAAAPQSYHGPHLYPLVEELHDLLAELGQDLSQDLVKREDPIARRIYAELDKRPFVDFGVHASVQSPRLKPVTRQIKRYVESKYYSSVNEIPKLSQLFFFDVLRGVVDMYHFLLNSEQSFLRHRGSKVTVAGPNERAAWDKERCERSRDSVELLRVRLAESEASSYIDELTGLKNKNYFLKELPRQFADLKQKQRPFCFLLLDLDHFKWVNDELGHQKGDEVLTQTAAALLDGIRLGHDVGIRYGGEELLLLVQAPLHNAVLLAERLRHAQQERVATLDNWAAIRELADDRGEPCATLSIGVVRADRLDSVDTAINRADRALYKAKEQRNSVVLQAELPDAAAAAPADQEAPLLSYVEYARSLRQSGR